MPLTTIDTDDIRSQINKELTEKEYFLKKAKKNKGGKPLTAEGENPSAPGPGQAIPIDDDVWSIPSDDEPGKAPKAKKETKQDDAAKAALKQAEDIIVENIFCSFVSSNLMRKF